MSQFDVSDSKIVAQSTVDDLQMGVMADGQAFISKRSLAKLCGTVPATVIQLLTDCHAGADVPRVKVLRRLLSEQGHSEGPLWLEARFDGASIHAVPEPVIMAVLEYYAFEQRNPSREAVANFRRLGRAGVRAFVYLGVGYQPPSERSWEKFQARLLINDVPNGYFSILMETAGLALKMIRAGIPVDQYTVPDISIGQHWSRHWEKEGLRSLGERLSVHHSYPKDFPQSVMNGSITSYAYPDAALPAFREWLRSTYFPTKLPPYLRRKVRDLTIEEAVAGRALAAVGVTPGELE